MASFLGRESGGAPLLLVALGSLVLWAIGMSAAFTLGGLIHVLLLFSLALVLIRLLPGPR